MIEVDKKNAFGRHKAVERLRSQTWDYVFVPHESFRTALWMKRLRVSRGRVGFRNWWNSPFFSHRVERQKEFPDAIRQLSLLTVVDDNLAREFAGSALQDLKSPQTQNSPLSFASPLIPDWASMQVIANQSATANQIFLAPGSVWGTKRWTARGYVELACMLLGKGYSVGLVGSSGEKDLCDQIYAEILSLAGADARLRNHAGTTSFAEMVKLLATGAALVCNDSGAMHAASVSALPTVAVFGPTTLDIGYRPWSNRAIVMQKELKCRPCGKHGPKVCPLGTHECMERISAREVWSALQTVLPRRQ